MGHKITDSIKDAWSRDFSVEETQNYVERVTGEIPDVEHVSQVFKALDVQFHSEVESL